jgi:hypothetical protein
VLVYPPGIKGIGKIPTKPRHLIDYFESIIAMNMATMPP